MSEKTFIIRDTGKKVESERISKLYDTSSITKFEVKYILGVGLAFGYIGSIFGLEAVFGGLIFGLALGDILARHDIKKKYKPVES